MAPLDIHKQLPKVAVDYDHVIIDTPPRIAEVTARLFSLRTWFSFQYRRLHLITGPATAQPRLLKKLKYLRRSCSLLFVVSKKIVGTAIAGYIVTALQDYEITVFNHL